MPYNYLNLKTMHSSQQPQISQSTLYRFQKVGRESELAGFVEFKKQFQYFLSEERISTLKKIYMHGIMGRNSKQQTVIVDRIGNIKLNELGKVIEDDEIVAYLNQRMLNLSEHVLRQKQQIIWVIDLTGKIMQLASKRVYTLLQRICYNMHKYFPEILSRLYFVNTPMLFDTIWNKVSDHVDAETQDKISFLTDELEELYMEVDSTLLPQFLGGDQSDSLLLGAQSYETKKEEEEDDGQEEENVDFNSLKQALSGLKLIGSANGQSVAQTPLNTEADDSKQ